MQQQIILINLFVSTDKPLKMPDINHNLNRVLKGYCMTEYDAVLIRLGLALLAGAIIGLERAFHGRPAGLRTHSLVCVSSSLLMLLTAYQWDLLAGAPVDTIRVDPTRMAQGIMTGIGFLGAGVIMREKLTIKGLTTAASVWMTASIGILIGMGFFSAGFMATFITLIILGAFGWLERTIPTRHFGRLRVSFKRQDIMERDVLIDFIHLYNIKESNLSYDLDNETHLFQYQMTVYAYNSNAFHKLSNALMENDKIKEFSIIPTGD